MQLLTQLPFGILCIFFTHYARVTAVCPTLPCDENVPVYGAAPAPLYSSAVSSAPAGESPVVSTTSPAVIVSSSPSIIPPVVSPSTSSISTPILPPTTASSAMSTSILIQSSEPPEKPTVVSSQLSSMGGPIATPPSTTVSSSANSTPNQSTLASSVSSVASNSSASVTVPASITQCGSCRVLADQVQVYYWPTASVKNDCARGASVSPFQTSVPYASNASRIQSLASQGADNPTTTVVDGYTL